MKQLEVIQNVVASEACLENFKFAGTDSIYEMT